MRKVRRRQEGREAPLSIQKPVVRCAWGANGGPNEEYHDTEWGRPVTDDNRLFEKICLEGFQSGLSWLTILRKRDRFREVFHDFDIARVARMTGKDVERLLQDAGIVRHRGKIESTINNAQRALEIQKEHGSLAAFVWSFEPTPHPGPAIHGQIPSETEASRALSKALRKLGFSFVGPTTCYAFMQAMGLVNDHTTDCFCRPECEAERQKLKRPAYR